MRRALFLLAALVPAIGRSVSVPVLRIADTINVGVADYVEAGLGAAQKEGAPFAVIELDTEGGTLQATRQIVQTILNSSIPVVVYVGPSGAHATSAGTFITLAADVAAMAPGTHIGAAHPVMAGGKMDEVMNEKATNDTAAFAESLAKTKKRNVEWARASVEKSQSITEKTALETNVIDLVVADREELFSKLAGYKLRVPKGETASLPGGTFEPRAVEMSLRHKLLSFFAHPQMALWILSLGGLCIWVELTHPGLFFPGVLGGICVILSLISLQMLPIHYGALALVLLGLGLMVAEVFFTSYGILGVGGAIAFIVGALFLVETDVPGFRITFLDVLPIVSLLGAGVGVLGYLVVKSRRSFVHTGMESLVGEFAEVREPVGREKEGKVFVFGELWNAKTDGDREIPPKAVVVVKEVRNMLLVVEPKESE